MLFENCGKHPAQRFVRNVDGREIVVQLCPACFRMLYSEKQSGTFSSRMGAAGKEDAACPVCGMTFGEFRRTGLLGCAGCYDAFREELCSTVRGIQGKLRHTGKRPEMRTEEDYDRMRAYVTRRASLREQLEAAMREHDYAAARKLQQELRALTAQREENV